MYPIGSRNELLEALELGHFERNVTDWSLVITENRTHPKNCVEALQDLRSEPDLRTKAPDITWDMGQNVQLGFDCDSSRVLLSKRIEKVPNQNLKIGLDRQENQRYGALKLKYS